MKELSELTKKNLKHTSDYKIVSSRRDKLLAEINRKQDQITRFYNTDGIYLNRWGSKRP